MRSRFNLYLMWQHSKMGNWINVWESYCKILYDHAIRDSVYELISEIWDNGFPYDLVWLYTIRQESVTDLNVWFSDLGDRFSFISYDVAMRSASYFEFFKFFFVRFKFIFQIKRDSFSSITSLQNWVSQTIICISMISATFFRILE
jgi:hypothetical protein